MLKMRGINGAEMQDFAIIIINTMSMRNAGWPD